MLNVENLQRLVKKAYVRDAIAAFGEKGETAITILLDAVKLTFQRMPPEALPCPLTVICGIETTPAEPIISKFGEQETLSTYEEIGSRLSTAKNGEFPIIELSPDGTFQYLNTTSDFALAETAQQAVVYRYEDCTDRILAKDRDVYVEKVSPILSSAFANATLDSLEDALIRYGSFVRETKCRILAKAWEGGVDGPRLVLANKPEATMRDSLAQALSLMLRDVSVRPEQNTDETKPVDIRVEWFGSGASALIEVKWLGRSTAKSKTSSPDQTYTDYGPARARDGADQLADYLDRQARHSNATAPRGYLVVFDARRKNVSGKNDLLSSEEALFFETDTLSYDPDHSEIRQDFAPPVRFFLMPRQSLFKAAA